MRPLQGGGRREEVSVVKSSIVVKDQRNHYRVVGSSERNCHGLWLVETTEEHNALSRRPSWFVVSRPFSRGMDEQGETRS